MADYYRILGVDRDATEEEIKKAYRRLARRHHPDANPDDPDAAAKFKEVAEAYSVLSDPARRRDYDMFGTAKMPAGGFDPFDLFRTFFGGDPFESMRRQRPVRGGDLALELQVSLEEVVRGATRTVTMRKPVTCERCRGSGAEVGSTPSSCTTCGGTGIVRNVQRSVFGNVMTSYTCPECGGSGERIEDPCRDCSGRGRIEKEEEVTIDIPPGVEHGTQYRMSGRGEAGPRGAPPGDLYVGVVVADDDRFERRGDHLLTRVAIPFTKAVLGGSIEVDSFEGPVTVDIEAGTQVGSVLRVKGSGVPRAGAGGRGDLLIEVDVEIPSRLTEEEEELLRRLAAERGEEVAEPKSFMGRIRGAFGG
jgi:molecular chaperone DnaJ